MMPWTPFSERRRNNIKRADSVDTSNVSECGIIYREKRGSFAVNIWRPRSLVNIVSPTKRRSSAVFDSSPTDDGETNKSITPMVPSNPENLNVKNDKTPESPVKSILEGWRTVVTIVLIEAKGLPDPPSDGSPHGLYCKLQLGSQTIKSKTIQNLQQPEWLERFRFYIHKDNQLKASLWDKGKQKTFMGSCVLDLSSFEWGRTHEIWQQLDNGYGSLHLSVTICNTRKVNDDTVEDTQCHIKHENFSSSADWKLVGQLYVKVMSGKGLSGRLNSYCTLEVDNERVRTHSARGAEPTWNKSFVFNVYDATSTLDLKVYETSLMTLSNESIGRVSIPLLRVRNGETKWFALKDKTKRNIARASCPRVLLEMSFFYNPIKASLKVFQPREVKYIIKKPQKFDIALVYKDLEFIRDAIVSLHAILEAYKRFLEWDNQELSFIALCCWLTFWYNFRLWTTPLFLLIPFLYFWICSRNQMEKSFMRGYETEKSLPSRLQQLPEMTLTITNCIDYIASLAERLYNLASFKVPFLSYLTMTLLVVASAALYIIPFNFIMIILGFYKFSRKYLRPERPWNNDLEDFLSRIPDTELLNDWKELSVPEPSPLNEITKQHIIVKDSVSQ